MKRTNWVDIFKDEFRKARKSLPTVLNAARCRELWLQGEFYRSIVSYDSDFVVNDFPIGKRKTADFYGKKPYEMVAELKVYGLYSNYVRKNLYGRDSVTGFLPKPQNSRILVTSNHRKVVNAKESSVIKDYFRLLDFVGVRSKYLILVLDKQDYDHEQNCAQMEFRKAIMAIKFAKKESCYETNEFLVRIWRIP